MNLKRRLSTKISTYKERMRCRIGLVCPSLAKQMNGNTRINLYRTYHSSGYII